MNAFEWISPGTIAEAVAALKPVPGTVDPDEAARPIAGGQDLLTTMKDYLTRPARVVNLKAIRGLDKITPDGKGGLRIRWCVVTFQAWQKRRILLPRLRFVISVRLVATFASDHVAGTSGSKKPSV
jgi:hypothetical protein